MMWPWVRRATIKTAIAPPPANGGAARPSMTTGEWDALVDAEDAAADAALERHGEARDRAISAVRTRHASGGHALVKR